MLNWLGKSKASIDDLVARKKYAQAVEAMRHQFKLKPPSAAERNRFAEVLILANRWQEAAPILIGLADEHIRFGFLDKAGDVLRRMKLVEPGRPDLADRWARLAAREKEAGESSAPAPAAGSPEPSAADGEPIRVAALPAEEATEWHEALDGDFEEAVAVDFEADLAPAAVVGAAATEGLGEGEAGGEEVVEAELLLEAEPVEAVAPAADVDTSPSGYPALRLEAARTTSPPPASEPPAADEPVEPAADTIADIAAGAIAEAVADPLPTGPGTHPGPALAEPSLLDFVRGLARRSAEASVREARPVLGAALFDGLDDDQLDALLPHLERRSFAAGDVVLTEGEHGDSVFVVASGGVKVFVRSPHGRNFEIARIDTLGFFGEIGALSSRRREASIVAAAACTVLEIAKPALDVLALGRAAARQLLEEACVERAMSPAAAAVRSVPEDVAVERAARALAAHFGESRWSPRMRLRLADVLLKAGNEKDALAILTGVAEDLAAAGKADKAIAVLKKVERIARRDVEELCLAPLVRAHLEEEAAARRSAPPGAIPPAPEEAFRGWLLNVLSDLKTAAAEESVEVRIDLAPLRRPEKMH